MAKQHPSQLAPEWARRLNWDEHGDGAYFAPYYRSARLIPNVTLPPAFRAKDDYASASAIVTFMRQGVHAAWFKIVYDEIYSHIAGDGLKVCIIDEGLPFNGTYPSAKVNEHFLKFGSDTSPPIITIPNDHWFCAEPMSGEHGYTMFVCFVTPGFHEEDHIRGNINEMIRTFPHLKNEIAKYAL